jgi:hypothetical protein
MRIIPRGSEPHRGMPASRPMAVRDPLEWIANRTIVVHISVQAA